MMKKDVKTVNKNDKNNKSKNGGVGNGVNDVNMTVTEAEDDGIDTTHTVTNGSNIVKKKKSACAIM